MEFDADRLRAEAAGPADGELRGLPFTIKSSIAVRGYRCEAGSLLRRGVKAEQDAEAVVRLRGHGALIAGTTNCPELLMAYETDNRLYGRTCNPWDPDRTAGGSSGGEAAAIAAGLSAGGLGSDSGGSVREPAHFCGICSLKPTPGRVPARGHWPPCVGPFSILGAIGPMARTVADLELFFRLLSDPDPLDPGSAPIPYRRVNLDEAKRWTVGWLEDDGEIPVTAETREAVRRAAQILERQGFRVRRFRPPSLEAARRLWWLFFMQCGAMLDEPLFRGREADLSPVFREFLGLAAAAPELTAETLLNAWTEWDRVRGALLEELREYPLLLTPVCAVAAFRHGERSWQIEGTLVHYLDAMRYTQWFNLLGAPAAVVPVSATASGLPIGVQIAGRPYADELVLAVAAAVESEAGYRPPPLALAP